MLILANNSPTALPPEIGQLHRLTTLDLGDNSLPSAPDELGDLPGDCLYLHDNRLSQVPDAGPADRERCSSQRAGGSARCRRDTEIPAYGLRLVVVRTADLDADGRRRPRWKAASDLAALQKILARNSGEDRGIGTLRT